MFLNSNSSYALNIIRCLFIVLTFTDFNKKRYSSRLLGEIMSIFFRRLHDML